MKREEICRAVQLRELEILKEIMKICDRHGLRYFADGGTCLGAVRHQGFIPWDDDMDIGMPREDFDRFRIIAPKELPQYLELMDFRQVKETTRFFLKVHDTRTAFIETSLIPYPELHTGVWVDILPHDGWPKPGIKRMILKSQVSFWKKVNEVLRMPDSTAEGIKGRLQFKLLAPFRRSHPFYWASDKVEALLRKCLLKDATYVVAAASWFYPECCTPETEKQPFENILISYLAKYDIYLKALYGDYMEFPPESERNSGHTATYISLDSSYHAWDGSQNIDPPNTLFSPLEKLALVQSRLVQHDFLQKGSWHDLARAALRKGYINLWYVIAHTNVWEHRKEIGSYVKRVVKKQLRHGQVFRAIRLYCVYRLAERRTRTAAKERAAA